MTTTGSAIDSSEGWFRRVGRRGRRAPGVAIGLIFVLFLALVALAAPWLAPHDPYSQDYTAILQPPSATHLLGTDNLGRDTLSRLIYGTRISLQVGLVAVSIAATVGIAAGLIAGYFGGWLDEIIMRIADAMYAFPALLLVLAIASALGPSLTNAMIAISVVYAPGFARLLRAQVLLVRELDYVTAARACGVMNSRIMLRHVLPNCLAPTIVFASLSVGSAILTEATLSFLGVGAVPPTPSWGSILQAGFQHIYRSNTLSLASGAAIFVTVLLFNILGDGLRTVLDPRIHV